MDDVAVPIIPVGDCHGNLPEYASVGAAGLDLRAAIPSAVTLPPTKFRLIPCGFAMALPSGIEGQIRPRSGLAMQHGVTVLNAPGTIDSDFRGEISVLLINLGSASFEIKPGMRIAQLVVARVCQ